MPSVIDMLSILYIFRILSSSLLLIAKAKAIHRIRIGESSCNGEDNGANINRVNAKSSSQKYRQLYFLHNFILSF